MAVSHTQATAPSATAAATAPSTPWSVREGDCLDVLAGLEAASIDAIVCDPPYGIDFQGEHWDGAAIREAAARQGERLSPGAAYQAFTRAWATECLRVLKPGAHLLAFGAPRTAHHLACGLEQAGLELRDTLMWLYGTGMPKSRRLPGGRGTQLKPAYEPIMLARKPTAGTIVDCLDRHGTGALSIDTCRVAERWPANVIAGHAPDCSTEVCAPGCAVAHVDEQAGGRRPSRILYCPKASRDERDAGCHELPKRALDLFPNAQDGHHPAPAHNSHPTVKPLALMRWLVRLVCPPDGQVLDPFCGSGSTGCAAAVEHRQFVGIERESAYAQIARARIEHHAGPAGLSACPLRPPGGDDERPLSLEEHDGPASQPSALPSVDEGEETGHDGLESPPPARLDADTIETLAQRVADLLAERTNGDADAAAQPHLASAAEIAQQFNVERAWVYQHATRLGVIRLGTGPRPRLRFDPTLVAQRINAPEPGRAGQAARSRRIVGDQAPLLPIRGQPELSSPNHPTDRPGGAPTPPATAPRKKASARR